MEEECNSIKDEERFSLCVLTNNMNMYMYNVIYIYKNIYIDIQT